MMKIVVSTPEETRRVGFITSGYMIRNNKNLYLSLLKLPIEIVH